MPTETHKQELTRRIMEISDELAVLDRRTSNLRVEFRTVNQELAQIIREEQVDAEQQQTHFDL